MWFFGERPPISTQGDEVVDFQIKNYIVKHPNQQISLIGDFLWIGVSKGEFTNKAQGRLKSRGGAPKFAT